MTKSSSGRRESSSSAPQAACRKPRAQHKRRRQPNRKRRRPAASASDHRRQHHRAAGGQNRVKGVNEQRRQAGQADIQLVNQRKLSVIPQMNRRNGFFRAHGVARREQVHRQLRAGNGQHEPYDRRRPARARRLFPSSSNDQHDAQHDVRAENQRRHLLLIRAKHRAERRKSGQRGRRFPPPERIRQRNTRHQRAGQRHIVIHAGRLPSGRAQNRERDGRHHQPGERQHVRPLLCVGQTAERKGHQHHVQAVEHAPEPDASRGHAQQRLDDETAAPRLPAPIQKRQEALAAYRHAPKIPIVVNQAVAVEVHRQLHQQQRQKRRRAKRAPVLRLIHRLPPSTVQLSPCRRSVRPNAPHSMSRPSLTRTARYCPFSLRRGRRLSCTAATKPQ